MASDEKERPFDPSKGPEAAFKVPDLVGTVEGWRAWRVEATPPPFGVAPKMYSATHGDYYWVPRRLSMAQCNNCGENVPGESCSCGFYSAKKLEDLLGMGYTGYDPEDGWIRVIGQVANWGKVIEGSQGWRAQKAYPVRLFVPFEVLKKVGRPLQRGYGVPVRPLNWLKQASEVDPDR